MRLHEAMKQIGGSDLTAYRSGWTVGTQDDAKDGRRIGIAVMESTEGPAEVLAWLVPAGKDAALIPSVVISGLTAEDMYATDWEVN